MVTQDDRRVGLCGGTTDRRVSFLTTDMRKLASKTILVVGTLVVAGSCATPAMRQAAENAEIKKEAAAEISRICALPVAEREGELEKLKTQEGVVIYCGTGEGEL